MIDAVLSYHTNPATCGVAKFNQRLARELGVPCVALNSYSFSSAPRHALISIKLSEIEPKDCWWFCISYDLFLHDSPSWIGEHPITQKANRVYAANQVIANKIRPARSDVIEAWCPSTIEGNPHRGTINVLTFGMAHKIQTARYEKLKTLLDATGEDYTVSVSTAIHEGSPWDDTALVAERLRAVFGDRLRVLGYLADDALARELHECTAVALFFEPALRANNTTFWAALASGKPVISNRDTDSPSIGGLYDIDELIRWPRAPEAHAINGKRFEQQYGWPKLIERLCAK